MHRSALLGLALLLAAGCGPEPLTVWKVTRTHVEPPASCYVDNIDWSHERTETDAQYPAGEWELYEGLDGKLFLSGAPVALARTCTNSQPKRCDFGDAVYEGGLKDDTYTFEAADSFVESDASPATRVETTTVTTRISFTIDGDIIEGELTQNASSACELSGCEPSYTLNNPPCTITYKLLGVRMDVPNIHLVP